MKKFFGKNNTHQTETASCIINDLFSLINNFTIFFFFFWFLGSGYGNENKKTTLKGFFKKKLPDGLNPEFKLLHLQTISSSRTLKQDGNESQIKPFLISDQ